MTGQRRGATAPAFHNPPQAAFHYPQQGPPARTGAPATAFHQPPHAIVHPEDRLCRLEAGISELIKSNRELIKSNRKQAESTRALANYVHDLVDRMDRQTTLLERRVRPRT